MVLLEVKQKKSIEKRSCLRHLYMLINTRYVFGFVHALEMIIYVLGLKLISERNNNDREFYRMNDNPGPVTIDCIMNIRGISWHVLSLDTSNDNQMVVVQKRLQKDFYGTCF